MSEDGPDAAESSTVSIELDGDYRFRVDFGEGFGSLVMDEPAPLGAGNGPNASRVLGAAVGNCLSASLLYCLRRARIDVTGLRTEVEVVSERNTHGRLRITNLRVALHPEVVGGVEGRFGRCLELFEDFCVVTESVRGGIDVDVEVAPAAPGLQETSGADAAKGQS
jgi:uncharacterized OsmC-like protein